jgi:hypothetical protein
VVRDRQPTDRRRRPQRWRNAVAKLLVLQASYATWLEALPDILQGTATADALQAFVDLDLDTLPASSCPAATDATDAIVACREPDGCSMVLAVGDGLKGCAARTGYAGFGP